MKKEFKIGDKIRILKCSDSICDVGEKNRCIRKTGIIISISYATWLGEDIVYADIQANHDNWWKFDEIKLVKPFKPSKKKIEPKIKVGDEVKIVKCFNNFIFHSVKQGVLTKNDQCEAKPKHYHVNCIGYGDCCALKVSLIKPKKITFKEGLEIVKKIEKKINAPEEGEYVRIGILQVSNGYEVSTSDITGFSESWVFESKLKLIKFIERSLK